MQISTSVPPVPDAGEKVAVVTGAARGLGASVAEALAEMGVFTVRIDREEIVPEEGDTRPMSSICLDVADPDAVSSAFSDIDATHGRVDFLVNCAGITGDNVPALDIDQKEWDRVLGVNLSGTLWMCQQAARRMVRNGDGGAIVNFSSISALGVPRGYSRVHYGVSKAGVTRLTQSLAAEWGKFDIRVNAISPGLHLTDMARGVHAQSAEASKFIEDAVAATPLGRAANPEDIVGVVVFLLSEWSLNITGQCIVSDGGRLLSYQ